MCAILGARFTVYALLELFFNYVGLCISRERLSDCCVFFLWILLRACFTEGGRTPAQFKPEPIVKPTNSFTYSSQP